jgi:hypothetical protein
MNVSIIVLDKSNIQDVANLMVKLKPEWWDLEGAVAQLSSGVGWYLQTNRGEPMGWLLCKPYPLYKTVEIECLGYDDGGHFKIGPELEPLAEKCEQWAKERGNVNLRFIIGSRGLSCHDQALGKPWQELKELRVIDREEYHWFTSMEYIPSGILPDIYGPGYHGIMLIKRL